MPAYRESYIFRVATDDPAIFWSGHGDLLLPADDVLPDPVVVPGAGELVSLPELEQLINGVAQRVEVVLSGVDERTVAIAAEEASQVPGAAVHIGRVTFDDDWQVVGAVEWEWQGEARALTISSEDTGNGRQRTLTLRVAAGDTTRSRAPLAFFTDADQRRAFADDDFFSNVGAINSGTSRRWGPK